MSAEGCGDPGRKTLSEEEIAALNRGTKTVIRLALIAQEAQLREQELAEKGGQEPQGQPKT